MKRLSLKWESSVLLMGYGHNIFPKTLNSKDVLSHLLLKLLLKCVAEGKKGNFIFIFLVLKPELFTSSG